MPVLARRATMQEARYTPAGGREKCAHCRWFAAPGTCNRIVGPVSPRGWCKYYSQQAVAVMRDGGDQPWSPGAGVPSGVTLDLNFLTMAPTLDPRITFTRASTATYFDATGTMQTAATNVARFDYDPVMHTALGLLIEESRTNVLISSGDLTPTATWVPNNITQTTSTTPAPTGAAMMTAFSETATTSAHYTRQNVTTVASATYTGSIYAKAATNRYLQVGIDEPNNGAYATFDLQTGTISGPLTTRGTGVAVGASIQAVGNGIYRCIVTATLGSATTGRLIFLLSNVANPAYAPSYAGNTANSLLVWGAQLEAGAFPTSYIPTTAAAVTRAADVATIASIPGRNATAESYQAEALLLTAQNNNSRIIGSAATAAASLYANSSRNSGANDTVASVLTANAYTAGSVAKMASTWASPNAGRACLNAGAVASAATLTSGFSGVTSFKFMGDSVAADQSNGYIRRFRYWPRILTDAEMQQVTT